MLAVAPDGERFLSGANDGYIGYWKLGKAQPEWLVHAHAAGVTWVSFSQSGKQIVSAGQEGDIILWDAKTAQPRSLNQAPSWSYVSFCSFINDNEVVVLRGETLFLIDIGTGNKIWEKSDISIDIGRPNRIAYSKTSKLLAIGQNVYDCQNGEPYANLDFSGYVNDVTFSQDGTIFLASDSQGHLIAYDLNQKSKVASTMLKNVASLANSGSSHSYFLAYDLHGNLHKIVLEQGFKIHTNNISKLLASETATSMAPLSDDKHVIMATEHGDIRVINWQICAVRNCWDAKPTLSMGAILPAGRRAIGVQGVDTGRTDIKLGKDVFFISDSNGIKRANQSPHSQLILDLAAIDSKSFLTVDRDGLAVVWKGNKVKKIHHIPNASITACTAWQEGKLGVVATDDEKAILIGSGNARKIISLTINEHPLNSLIDNSHHIRALSARCKPMIIFALYNNGEAIVHERSGQIRLGIKDSTEESYKGALKCTVTTITKEVKLLASGNIDGYVCIWNPISAQMESSMRLHEGKVTSLAFDDTGARLYSAGIDRFIYCTDTSTKQVIAATMLPSYIIDLLFDRKGQLHALDVAGNLYSFKV